MDNNLKRLDGETQDQYFYRICSMKESLGFTWPQMTEIFNSEFGCSKGDTAYRKQWAAFNKVFNANADKLVGENAYSNELQVQLDEIYKAKRQLWDQRREYNKILTSDARADHLAEKLIEAANLVPLKNYSDMFTFNNNVSNEEAVLCLSDWHYGQISNNIWNEYNIEICKERVIKLFDKVSHALKEHGIKTLHIVLLGDFVNGAIHTGVRVASEENTCDQLMHVSEVLANFINALSVDVDKVNVYSTYGNHARTIQNKNDSIHADNMERVIPWWLKQRLKVNTKVNIIDSEYYEFIYFDVCGYNIVCTHGDLDKFTDIGITVNTLFSKKFDKTIDYTFSGDKHHLESFEQFGIESALVGSLCGTDEFANNKRLYSNPMQTLCIFTPEDGKLCTYNIKL
jgi:hypothetical protein